MTPGAPDVHPVEASPFDLKAVEDALARLWRSEGEPGGHDAIRACSANFLIPIGPGRYDTWQQRITDLSRLVPSRIVLLERAPADAKPEIDAFVTATCHRRKGGLLVCSETVHIRAVPAAALRLPGICRALAVADLPLYLLVVEPSALPDDTGSALGALADRVLVDSAAGATPGEAIHCDGDLVWPRLVPWRSAVGNFLSGCHAFRAGSVRRVRVASLPASTRLMAGWLGLLLDWCVPAGEPREPVLRAAGEAPVTVNFEETPSAPCGIARLRLETEPPGDHVEFAASGEATLDIRARLGGEVVQSRIALRARTFAQEVAAIVHSHGVDRVYDLARRIALALPAKGGTA